MKQIEIVNGDLTKISKSADEAGDAINDLSKDMKGLAQEAKAADGALQEFNSDNFDLLETMENATRVTAGFVGAVEVAQGTLHLMGVDNEFVNKSLEDMMALMQVSQGLTDMADGIKSFKMLKEMIAASTAVTTVNTAAVTANATATTGAAVATTGFGKALNMCKGAFAGLTKVIKANPYAAVVTAILAAVTAIGAFAKKSNDAAKQQELLAAAQKKVLDVTKKSIKETDREYQLMIAAGKAEEDALKFKIKKLKLIKDELALKKLEFMARKADGENIEQEKIDELGAQLDEIATSIDDTEFELKKLGVIAKREAQEAAADAAQARIDAEKDANEKILEERRAAQKELNEEYEELLDEEAYINKKELDKELSDIQKHTKERLKYWRKMYDEQKISAEDFTKISNQLNISSLSKQQDALAKNRKELLQNIVNSKEEFINLTNEDKNISLEKALSEYDKYYERLMLISDKSNILGEKISINGEDLDYIDIYVKAIYERITSQSQLLLRNLTGFFLKYDFDENLIEKIYGNLDGKQSIDTTINDLENLNKRIGSVFIVLSKELSDLKEEYTNIYTDNSLSDTDKNDKLNNITEKIKFLIENLKEAGNAGDVINNIEISLLGLSNDIIIAGLDKIDSKFDNIQQNISLLSEKFNELQQIGAGWGPDEGISDKWNSVFGSISSGIEKVRTGFKDAAKETDKAGKSWKKYGTLAVAGLSVASNMMQAIADEQDATSEEGFERQKKWQIGAATMSMLGGIVDAWASAFMPSNELKFTWQKVAMGSAMSAMILATGLMQINKIKQTKFGGDSGAGGAQATPAIGALENMQNGMQYANIIEGASTEGQIEDTRVYVVESDITNVQNKVKVAQNEATF